MSSFFCPHLLILGLSWLQIHNPVTDWSTGNISVWFSQCVQTCMPCSIQTAACQVEQISTCHKDSLDRSSKGLDDTLPPKHSYDCFIDLLPDATLPRRNALSLSAQPPSVSAVPFQLWSVPSVPIMPFVPVLPVSALATSVQSVTVSAVGYSATESTPACDLHTVQL